MREGDKEGGERVEKERMVEKGEQEEERKDHGKRRGGEEG